LKFNEDYAKIEIELAGAEQKCKEITDRPKQELIFDEIYQSIQDLQEYINNFTYAM